MEAGILVEFLKEKGRAEGIEQGRAEERSNAEKIINALQKENEKLRRQLALQV